MMQWISQHSASLQVFLNGLMVVIWILYLQVFLVSFRRQRRPEILINVGAGAGLGARCFVGNLGLEPIYTIDVIVEIETNGERHKAIITDRTEMTDQELSDWSEATNQGPLGSGDYCDIGSFETLVSRAASSGFEPRADRDVGRIKILIIAAMAAKGSFVGAEREYVVERDKDRVHLKPTTIAAKQINSRSGRRRLRRELQQRLAD